MKYRKRGEVGQVIDVKQNIAIISMTRNEACQQCGACSHGHRSEEMILEAKNLCNAKVGDKVVIDLSSSDFLKATFIMYGLPLILLFTGFIIGYYGSYKLGYTSLQEPMGVLFGFLFMTFSYFWIRANEEKLEGQNYRPLALKIVE